jgi:hypothetical protein
MRIAVCTLMAVLLLGCASANVESVQEPGGDLSLTEPPEYPGYLLIAPSDFERIMTRMHEAELKIKKIYEDTGVAIPK